MTSLVFYLLSMVIITSGILTIIGKNPINSVVYLVICFGNSALIFMLMGVDLLGLIYIIVYIGAIAILFIFVIMMMDLRIPEGQEDHSGLSDITEKESVGFLVSYAPSRKFLFSLGNLPFIIITSLIISMGFYEEMVGKEWNMEIPEGPVGQSGNIYSLFFDLTTWEIAERNIWEDDIQNSMNSIIQSVGYLIYTDFLSLLLLASLILLMVMISVITLIVG